MAGRADLIGRVAARLYAPGIGIDAGGVPGSTLRIFFQVVMRPNYVYWDLVSPEIVLVGR